MGLELKRDFDAAPPRARENSGRTVGAAGEKHGLPLGSIPLFDLGVYLVVLGTVLAILFALEEVVAAEADRGD